MKIFFVSNTHYTEEDEQQQNLVRQLATLGVSVVTKRDVQNQNLHALEFESLDAFIINGSALESEDHYLLAIALAHNKPVQCLLKKGSIVDHSIEKLHKQQEKKNLVSITFYSPDTYEKKVISFLQRVDEDIGKEGYTIKYTLRLTPRLNRYVSWKVSKLNMNKADFIRENMEAMMKVDSEYTNRIK